ncbi:MgtC family protein [Andreprevotia lacus DSM 23236]|jgi:putative Mg2+ transporter-C (MgtC) family protein|uniref:Protein MgtC n=1 Tax=Andreprevotia lacus DSM 23236 TaxID=1121001 RepID=A0A1W1X593_9NEIS|nr:MgtC/SapB family protein [Andreprevotia lacus]SMC19075.1 MgtC family protein [Andreprevotia lacus DSM 23236]
MFAASPDDLLHITHLFAAVVLGGLIGLERQWRHHPAGLHTNALVALGAAAYVLAATLGSDPTGPARVAGQVVTGVGFLCAGLIWHEGGSVRGINTAATVWCSCTVGVLAGLGQLKWAIIVGCMVVLANVILHLIDHRMNGDAG